MPIRDPIKRQLAMQHRLYFKVCRTCGARNALSAVRCRNCKSKNLRFKHRELTIKR